MTRGKQNESSSENLHARLLAGDDPVCDCPVWRQPISGRSRCRPCPTGAGPFCPDTHGAGGPGRPRGVVSRSWDELQRKQALEGMLVAFFVVGMGTFLYGFLEGVGFPKLDVIWVFPALIMVQGVAQLIVRSRY